MFRNIEIFIMGIFTKVNFEFIDPKEGMSSYTMLVGRHWGRIMNAVISLEKDRITLKGYGKRIIIPLNPMGGKP